MSCFICGPTCQTAWTSERGVPMCEAHATRWLMGERDMLAEMEEVSGRRELIRPMRRPSPGSLRAIAARYGRSA